MTDLGPVTRRVPQTVTLNGWSYSLQHENYEFGPQDNFRDGVVANDEPSDSMFNARGAWARYRVSWHHGADQQIGDFVDEADPFRFDQSFGWNVWDQTQMRLLPGPELHGDISFASAAPILQRSSTYIYAADGLGLVRIEGASLLANSVTDFEGSITSLSTDGIDLYIASTLGLYRVADTDGVATLIVDGLGAFHKIAFVANRLLAAQANVLYEVDNLGNLSEIVTHFQPAFRWTAIFAIGSRIYVGGFAGVKSELYTLTTDETGVLVRAQEAAPIPLGEQLLCGVSHGGAVLLGTSEGVRFAQIGADGTLTYGPLIDKIGACRQIAVEGSFAWTTWNDPDTHLAGQVGIARIDLAHFVDVLQPAYAADVYVNSATSIMGVARHETSDGNMLVFATDDGRFYYVFNDGESFNGPKYATTAKLTSGELLLGSVEPKGVLSVEARFAPLVDETSITVTVIDEEGNVLGSGTADTVGQNLLEVELDGSLVRSVRVSIEAAQPFEHQVVFYSWRIRSYPAPPQVLQWIMPLNTHEVVDQGEGQGESKSQAANEVLTRIIALHESHELVELVAPEGTFRVRVESFKHVPARWASDGMAHQGTCTVQLVSA